MELTELLGRHLHELDCPVPEVIDLQPVRRGRSGDLSTAVAHRVAGAGAGQLAVRLARRLEGVGAVAQARAEAGYLILTLTTTALATGVRQLLDTAPRRATGTAWPAPLHPVAFAHARCRNVARAARAHGVRPDPGAELESTLTAVVGERHTRRLLVRLTLDRPGGTGAAVALRDLAACYQDFYRRTRTAPRGSEPVASVHRTHLAVTEATAVALATGLAALGLHAPEHL